MRTPFSQITLAATFGLALAFTLSCSSGGGGGGGEETKPNAVGKTEDGKDVLVFQDGSLDGILIRVDTTAMTNSSFTGTLIFKNMNPDEIPSVGDIIASAGTENVPYGFLYKVLGVSTKDGFTAVVVRNARLEEAIKDVEFSGEVEYDFDEEGNTLAMRQKVYPGAKSFEHGFPFSFKQEIGLERGNIKGNMAVEVKFTVKFKVDITIKNHKIQIAKRSLSLQDAELALEGKVAGKIDKELSFPIKKIPLPPAEFRIYAVPVKFINNLELDLKISGNAELGMDAKFNLKGYNEYGIKKENEEIKQIKESHFTPTFKIEHYNEGNVRIGIVTEFSSALYGAIGLDFEAGPAFDISVSNASPFGVHVYDKGFSEVDGGAKISLGFGMKMKPYVLIDCFMGDDLPIFAETFISTVLHESSALPKFAGPNPSEDNNAINVESKIKRDILSYPVSEYGFCVEKSAGECKDGNGDRKIIANAILDTIEHPFNHSFALEEGTTYRIMPYFKNGVGGTYYDKATVYPPSSSSSSEPSSSSETPSSGSQSCGSGLDGVWGEYDEQVTISGSIGVFSAVDDYEEYVKVGDQIFRGITSTGDLTWSGQYNVTFRVLEASKEYKYDSVDVDKYTEWHPILLTMSADRDRERQILTIKHLDNPQIIVTDRQMILPHYPIYDLTRKCND